MKILIAGSRTITDKRRVAAIIKQSPFFEDYWSHHDAKVQIVHGGCPKGVDKIADQFADHYGMSKKVFEADWDKHGKGAGPKRNSKMAKYADVLIAIWDGKSKGTLDMIKKALMNGLDVYVKCLK